jgi:hypothetical protein
MRNIYLQLREQEAGVEKIPVKKKTGIWYECKQVMVVVVAK